MKIGFLVNDLHLSGGVNVVVKHASALQRVHGHEVSIVISSVMGWHAWRYRELKDVRVVHIKEVAGEEFDVVVATWWETVFNLGLLKARSTVWFMQSLEDRFYQSGDPMQLLAQSVYSLNIPVITEASWIRDFLRNQNPSRPVGYAVNGIEKEIFHQQGRLDPNDGPIRILIEGSASAPNKGVSQCFDVIQRMTQPNITSWVSPSGATAGPGIDAVAGPLTFEEMADVYRRTDVLLKLSRVEGMFGPPLEAFHCGATAVVAPVTGAEEYIRHGVNSIVVPWDDVVGTAAVLDRLARNREEVQVLKLGAAKTASCWPDWAASSEEFNRELTRLCNDPRSVSTEVLNAQASVLRSLRVPMRLMHENSISTLRAADGAFRRISELHVEIADRDRLLGELNYVHGEKLWWDHFSSRIPIRLLLAVRRRWRKIRRRGTQ